MDDVEELARELPAIRARLGSADVENPWQLTWLLAVGMVHSLKTAVEFLPATIADVDPQAVTLVEAIAAGTAPSPSDVPTWSLGYYLNSTELRIQSALHRLLQAYCDADGYAFALADQALSGGTPPASSRAILLGFVSNPWPGPDEPGGSLRAVWARANHMKHDPAHNISDRAQFNMRFTQCCKAVRDILVLLVECGEQRGAVDAA